MYKISEKVKEEAKQIIQRMKQEEFWLDILREVASKDQINKRLNRINTAEDLKVFKDELFWSIISHQSCYEDPEYNLSEDFMREFQAEMSSMMEYGERDETIFHLACGWQKISLSFIREFEDKINLEYVATNPKFKETDEFIPFLHEFKDRINWSWCLEHAIPEEYEEEEDDLKLSGFIKEYILKDFPEYAVKFEE